MPTLKPILITGAAGYIGLKLIQRAMELRIPVIAVDIVSGSAGPLIKNITKPVSELTEDDIDDACQVIHLAAIVGTAACEKNPEEALKTNLEATIHLCHLANKKPIYFTNTNIGYPQGASDETAELKSENVYGRSKIEAEKVILEHGGISLRLASVFGMSPRMRDDLLVHYLVKEFVTKEHIELFDMDSMRNFICIKDVCRLLLEPIGLKRGEAYNVCIPKHQSKRELVKLIENFVGPRSKKELGKKDPDNRNYHLSTEKVQKDAGFKPIWFIKDELPKLISYYSRMQDSKGKSL